MDAQEIRVAKMDRPVHQRTQISLVVHRRSALTALEVWPHLGVHLDHQHHHHHHQRLCQETVRALKVA